ncbi:MAG: polysaccharide export protein, partial [Methanobacteriota archaeon]
MNVKATMLKDSYPLRDFPIARKRREIAATALLLLVSPLLAQVNEPPVMTSREFTRPDAYDSRRLTYLRIPGTSSDYVLGPGDLIDVKIVGFDFLNESVRISGSGQVSLPHLGVLQAADLTAEQFENKIAEELVAKRLVKEPEVLVYVQEYRSKTIYMLGELDRPGEYTMTQQLYLMDAILLAGGLDFTAADRAFLHRRSLTASPPSETDLARNPAVARESDAQVLEIDLRPMKEGRMINPNPALRAGDSFFIPEVKINFFYVIGEVGRAGIFEMPANQGRLLASRAISLAGGPNKTAKMSEGILVRYKKDGSREELPVDFAA